MIELGTLNAFLDVILKTLAIVIAAYLLFLLKNFNEFVEKAEASAESVEHTAEAVEKSVKWGKILPLIGGDK